MARSRALAGALLALLALVLPAASAKATLHPLLLGGVGNKRRRQGDAARQSLWGRGRFLRRLFVSDSYSGLVSSFEPALLEREPKGLVPPDELFTPFLGSRSPSKRETPPAPSLSTSSSLFAHSERRYRFV